MAIGSIISVPTEQSSFAQVKDEYGTNYLVNYDDLSSEAQPGDQIAYEVKLRNTHGGTATTLTASPYASLDDTDDGTP